MADIKVRIELNKNANEESIGNIKTDNLTFANTSIEPNSAGVFNNMPTRDNTTKGINALTFGQDLYFNENGMLDNVDNYGGGLDSEKNKFEIVWGIVNPDNTYNVKIIFESAENLKDIVIYGDKESNQFPTRAILDNKTEVFSDDFIWTLQFENESNTHTIEFTHWNRANYNAVLTFIGVMLKYIEIDKRSGLKSVESLSQSTGQPNQIFYGLVPNTCSLEIIDVDGEILDMVNDNIIPNSGVSIDIFANGNKFNSHISNDSNYTSENKVIKISGSDKLEKLSDIKIKRRFSIDSVDLYSLLESVMNEVNQPFNCSSYVKINGELETIENYLKSIKTSLFDLTDVTFSEFIQYICELSQLNCYINKENEIKFVSARPTKIGGDSIIRIPLKLQMSSIENDFILKNNYNGVTFEYVDVDTIYYAPYKQSSKFIGEDGNYDLSSLGDLQLNSNGDRLKIITENNTEFLCFFKKIETSNNAITYVTNPKLIQYSSDSSQSFTISSGIMSSNDSINQFDFLKIPSTQDSSYPIYVAEMKNYRDMNYRVYACRIPRTSNFVSTTLEIQTEITSQVLTKFSPIEYGGNKNTFSYNSNNPLINVESKFGNSSLYNMIAENILTDYSNGIKTIKFECACSDLYYLDETLAKRWDNGELLEIGDVIQIDKDNNKNSLFVDKNNNVITFKVSSVELINEGVPLLKVQAQQVVENVNPYKSTFATDSWSKIHTVSLVGLGSKFYSVGDEKHITLSTGEEIVLVILNISGSVLTVGTKTVLNNPNRMYYEGYSNQWDRSYMRNVVLEEIYNTLPTELADNINNHTTYFMWGDSRKSAIDKLWIPSKSEVFGLNSGDGSSQFEYYKDINNRIKTKINSTDPQAWWLRDTSSGGNTWNHLVRLDGKLGEAGGSMYISFCFNI